MNFQEFLDKYQVVPVEHYVNKVVDNPVVSICVMTYQHVNFIKECLDGILMQETNFDFEVLLGEDASTDGTREICIEYAEKYPNKIKLFLHRRENNISIGGSPTGRFNFFYNLFSANGKYIALCEGDDYWTDPKKLQKQMDFLEENIEYGLIHGDCHFYYQGRKKWKYNANKNILNILNIENKSQLFNELINWKYKIRTATVLFKKSLLNLNLLLERNFLMADTPMWLDFSQKTKFKYFNDVYSVYRISDGTVSNPKSIKSQLKFKLSGYMMRFYYCEKFNYEVPTDLINRYNILLQDYSLLTNDFRSFDNNNYKSALTEQIIRKNLKLNSYIKLWMFYFKHPRLVVKLLKLTNTDS